MKILKIVFTGFFFHNILSCNIFRSFYLVWRYDLALVKFDLFIVFASIVLDYRVVSKLFLKFHV
jgi:hypothetical protein